MRTYILLGLCLLIMSCDLSELQDICNETPSTQNLLSIRNVDFAGVGTSTLSDPVNHLIEICSDHFAANTPAGHQYNLAADEVNRIEGSELHFTNRRSGITHIDAFDLFPANPTASFFDYIDVNAPMPNECSLPGDLTFAMRLCRYDQSGGQTNFFTLMAKSTTYGHFSDPSSDDYPQKHGILHELGHAWGMKHTPNWNNNDKDYISTMQGNLTFLSALDVAYLRHNYPTSMPEHRNYVASSLTRFNGSKGTFINQNPDALYIDADGNLLDCATNAAPTFSAAWFNTGDLDGDANICGANKIFLREKSVAASTIDIKTWKFATMPNLSQDQWQEQVQLQVENVANINFDREWELVFKVNAWATQDELTDEDNEVSKEIELYQNSCSSNAKKRNKRRKERTRLPD